MPAPTSAEMVADLRKPNLSVEEAEDMLVELIEGRRVDTIERWKIGRELDALAEEMPDRLLPALELAKGRTLLTASSPSPVAFSISATRSQVVQHLIKQGLRNPALAREILLEFVSRKERSVRGWPGGVRASIEVVQGGLRDIGIELGISPVSHLVEQIQLETGHISLAQLTRFLKSFPPPTSPASRRVHESESLPTAERALCRWAHTCLASGSSRFVVGVELEEIKRQIGSHLHAILPVVLKTSQLPSFPCHPHAHGLASTERLVLSAMQADPDPVFATEVLMEYVGWAKRRVVGAWGRIERAEMGTTLVGYERVLAESAATVHLAPVVQGVRFNTRCPPFDLRTLTPATRRIGSATGDAPALDPHQMEAILSAKPRTMDDGQVGAMLQAYIDSEQVKAGESVLDVGGWGESDKRRVGQVLQTMRERLDDPSLDLIFGAVMLELLPAGTITPVLTPPSSERSHPGSKAASLTIVTTPLAPLGPTNGKSTVRSSPPSPSPTIPLPPVPSRRQTTEVGPAPPSRPSLDRRQQSEQNTSSTPIATSPTSILKKQRPDPVSVIVSGPDDGVATPAATVTVVLPTAEGQPSRPVKSSRRFSLFGGGKKKSEDAEEKPKDSDKDKGKGAEKVKEKPASPPKKDKNAPPSVPKSTSTPKRRTLSTEDLQLRQNTEANKIVVPVPALPTTLAISHPAPLGHRPATGPIQRTTETAPLVKSVSSLSFADSVTSTNTTSTTASSAATSTKSKDDGAAKPDKKRNLLQKKQASTSSSIGRASSMVDLPSATDAAAVSAAEALLAYDIHPTMPAALSSTGDLHGRLERAQGADATVEVVGVATPRPRKSHAGPGDGRRKSMVDMPSAEGDKISRRFSLFGSKKSKKADRFPNLPPSPSSPPQESFDLRRRSVSRTSSQSSFFDGERPTSKLFLNDRDFPSFSQLRAPHQMNSPPRAANQTLAPLPVSASPHTSPRQAWRSPAATFSRGSKGMSTPPIMEGDSELSGSEDTSTSWKERSTIVYVPESDPGHGGLLVDEPPRLPTSAVTRVYQLADHAAAKDFDLTRKIDPPAPSPPPPAPPSLPTHQDLHERIARHAATNNPSTPPLTPRAGSPASGGLISPTFGPPSPAATPVKTSPEQKSRPESAISFGADAGPALSMLFANGSASSSPARPTFSTSPPAPKRSLPPPPPSPTTSAGPSSGSHHDQQERVPPILTVRAVFAALSPTETHSTGKVLDILTGFIDREREQSIRLDRKRGWGEAERTKAGWIISEIEAELLPTNPHLKSIIERVRVLTDCPPQVKAKKRSSKRIAPSEVRPALSTVESSSSLATVSSISSAASTSTDASTVSASTFATDSSLQTDATGDSEASSRASSDSEDTVIMHASPSSLRDHTLPDLERQSSTRIITVGSSGDNRVTSRSPQASRAVRPFVPASSFDSLPSRAIHARSGSGGPAAGVASTAHASFGTPVRSNTVAGPRSPRSGARQHDSSVDSSGRRTSSETAPPPYERAGTSSSLRDAGALA